MRKMVKEKQARHVALPRDATPDGSAIEKPFWRQSRRSCMARQSLATSSTGGFMRLHYKAHTYP